MSAKAIVDMVLCQGEFVYLDKDVVFSNAWSGRLFVEHRLAEATAFAANDAQEFLVTDGSAVHFIRNDAVVRSEEHTSELQSLMRISYAVFCLKKNKNKYIKKNIHPRGEHKEKN